MTFGQRFLLQVMSAFLISMPAIGQDLRNKVRLGMTESEAREALLEFSNKVQDKKVVNLTYPDNYVGFRISPMAIENLLGATNLVFSKANQQLIRIMTNLWLQDPKATIIARLTRIQHQLMRAYGKPAYDRSCDGANVLCRRVSWQRQREAIYLISVEPWVVFLIYESMLPVVVPRNSSRKSDHESEIERLRVEVFGNMIESHAGAQRLLKLHEEEKNRIYAEYLKARERYHAGLMSREDIGKHEQALAVANCQSRRGQALAI